MAFPSRFTPVKKPFQENPDQQTKSQLPSSIYRMDIDVLVEKRITMRTILGADERTGLSGIQLLQDLCGNFNSFIG